MIKKGLLLTKKGNTVHISKNYIISFSKKSCPYIWGGGGGGAPPPPPPMPFDENKDVYRNNSAIFKGIF